LAAELLVVVSLDSSWINAAVVKKPNEARFCARRGSRHGSPAAD
jgi:hypothetical protein